MTANDRGVLHEAAHEPLLGTLVTVRVRAIDEATAVSAERLIVAEIERLEAILSAHRPASEWSRWRRGEVTRPGAEIVALLDLAARWHAIGGGTFHPLAGVLRARWLCAAEAGVAPSRAEMADLAATIADLPYRVHDGTVERAGDCTRLDLHAIAKGWIVDRAVTVVSGEPGIAEVLVNAGGDLLHRGPAAITVGIEDPRRPFDNVPPLARVPLRNMALAASSGARRPLLVGGVRHSHVLDPRTGWPIEHVLGATAIAPDAATADVIATIVGVLPVADGLRFADTHKGVACLLLAADGLQHASARWPAPG
ncbi:MAG: FAD:protein FMN transferase [Actinomycetota bacterium]|nr:FAD:protein FMN transferase [Actinomycetota bacterium]